jgi:hypothetical protein
MIAYIFRRLMYGALILIGVNLATFFLFFTVNTTDDMARVLVVATRQPDSDGAVNGLARVAVQFLNDAQS